MDTEMSSTANIEHPDEGASPPASSASRPRVSVWLSAGSVLFVPLMILGSAGMAAVRGWRPEYPLD